MFENQHSSLLSVRNELNPHSKGQVTVPFGIRKALNLRPGDQLDFRILDDREEIKKVAGTLEDFVNTLPKAKKTFSVAQMNEAIASAAGE